jgi:hypothetical protein
MTKICISGPPDQRLQAIDRVKTTYELDPKSHALLSRFS